MTIHLPPILSDRIPAIGATIIGMPVHGSTRIPAASGESPKAVWKTCERKNTAPNIPKDISSALRLISGKLRPRNRCIGTIGASVRSSQSTNAVSSTAPATKPVSTSGVVQPASPPRIRPSTTPSSPPVASTVPRTSSRRTGPRLSVRPNHASGSSTTPSGTFTQKIHCHEAASTTAPPITGPSATASPPMAPQAPTAAPRFSGRTLADSSVRLSGTITAPPMPCTARAAISTPMFGASAETTEARGEDGQAERRTGSGGRSGRRAWSRSAGRRRR